MKMKMREINKIKTNTEGEKVLLCLIKEIIENDAATNAKYNQYLSLRNKLNELVNSENAEIETKYRLISATIKNAENEIRELYTGLGLVISDVSVKRDLNCFEITSENASFRIMLTKTIERQSTSINVFKPNFSIALNNASELEVLNAARIMQATVNNMYKIIDILSEADIQLKDITNKIYNYNAENVFVTKMNLQSEINMAIDDLIQYMQRQVIIKLANERFSWFEKYIDEENKNKMLYSIIKHANIHSKYIVNNFDSVKYNQTKMQVLNTNTNDVVNIKLSKISDFVPCIFAGKYSITFTYENIERIVKNIQ